VDVIAEDALRISACGPTPPPKSYSYSYLRTPPSHCGMYVDYAYCCSSSPHALFHLIYAAAAAYFLSIGQGRSIFIFIGN
jgi:hypothetical protein